jgi:hypothetical protein
VEGLDGNISSFYRPFQQRSEVFQPVSVDSPAHIGFGVVDDRVSVGVGQAIAGGAHLGILADAPGERRMNTVHGLSLEDS